MFMEAFYDSTDGLAFKIDFIVRPSWVYIVTAVATTISLFDMHHCGMPNLHQCVYLTRKHSLRLFYRHGQRKNDSQNSQYSFSRSITANVVNCQTIERFIEGTLHDPLILINGHFCHNLAITKVLETCLWFNRKGVLKNTINNFYSMELLNIWKFVTAVICWSVNSDRWRGQST